MKPVFTFLVLILCNCYLKAQNTTAYIDANALHAQELMRTHQLPASLILGVAIHESAAGTSKISRYLNNHFGVKGKNSNTEINSSYKDYPSVDSSYNHFVAFLHLRPYFNVLFTKHNQYDYKNWAIGIQKAGYASSKTWAKQVIAIINKYKLYQYDERPADYVEIAESTVILKPLVTNYAKKSKTYFVKKGDNLSTIAKRLGATTAILMRKNNLKTSALQPGQKIKF